MNPLIQGKPGTTLVMYRNAFSTNQGTNEDDSQSDLHPEAGIFGNQTMRNSGQKDRHDMVTGATKQIGNRRDLVTGVQRESLCGRDMVRGVERECLCQRDLVTRAHEEVTYCSPTKSSGKQKKNRPTSQPQFRSENTPATIETDQILLALQQLANNNNFENFHNNINRICNLPNSLTTNTFDGKSEKFELFEDLFQTSLKNYNQLTEDDRINYFHSLMKGDALRTFRIINGPTREKLGEILAVFRKKYVKPQSMASAKHKFQKLVFKNWPKTHSE